MQKFSINTLGQITLSDEKRTFINDSPIGILVVGRKTYAPISAEFDGKTAVVKYMCGDCTFTIEEKKGYHKLTITSVPEDAETFIFGPYFTDATSYGEILGAGWFDDGSAACIQSLMPKVVGGISERIDEDTTELKLTERKKAAFPVDGKISLQCSVLDMSKDEIIDDENTIRFAVPGPDGFIKDASIALIGTDSSDSLIDIIGDMELVEGLPHPTYQGKYAKKDKRVSSYYLIIKKNNFTNKELIDMAARAGVCCIYFTDVFSSWGHFDISPAYEKGAGQVHELADYAESKEGIVLGGHTLSAFIHQHDKFVTPVPHNKLLAVNLTTLTKDITEEDTDIYIKDANNYAKKSVLNYIRIGEELIKFTSFDSETKCLKDCTRGVCNTAISAHSAGEEVCRLADHGYATLFPNIELQREMAENLGNATVACGIRRLSFDGLEGCYQTKAGEYALAKFVKTVFDITGNDFTCDASTSTHYLWHALCYANWGEPWCDTARRGGMYMNRVNHIPFFKRNLIPLMMGWYAIYAADRRFEATTPENMEFMLSRSAAFDAGLAITVQSDAAKQHGMLGDYLDMAKMWGEFRHEADIPEDILHEMQYEDTNWHLEKADDGWKLSRIMIHHEDLYYRERSVETETGYLTLEDNETLTRDGLLKHVCQVSPDASAGEGTSEVYRFRIRVGEPGHGMMIDPEIVQFGLKFKLTAIGGDYLVYNGGTEIYHYDCNFNLKQIVQSEPGGNEFVLTKHRYLTFKYLTDDDKIARYMLTDFRKIWERDIKPKA